MEAKIMATLLNDENIADDRRMHSALKSVQEEVNGKETGLKNANDIHKTRATQLVY